MSKQYPKGSFFRVYKCTPDHGDEYCVHDNSDIEGAKRCYRINKKSFGNGSIVLVLPEREQLIKGENK